MTGDLFIGGRQRTLVLDASGAAWWPQQATLVFADIHFEKGSSYARRGALLPPYDTRTALRRMGEVVARRQPKRIIALGDSRLDCEAADRLDAEERAILGALGRAAEWVWITGNHDPAPPAWLGGTVTEEIALGRLIFRRELA